MSGTTPHRPATTRGGLGGPLIAFIVFDVLLVVAAVWLAVSLATGGSDGGQQDPGRADSGASAPSAEGPSSGAPAPVEEPSEDVTEDADVEQVASPSGNIACELTVEGARCAIAELAVEPAPVEGCDGTVGYVVEVTDDGVDVPCVTSDEPQLAAGGGPSVLQYGEELAVGAFVCVSSEAGMTCTNTGTGQGFTLARAGVAVIG